MPGLSVILNGDGCWPDLAERPPEQVKWDTHIATPSIARLPIGTVQGNDSVTLRLDMPNGDVILTQLTMKLFLAAADAFRARMEMEGKPQ
jgi:hypothetical protein